MGDLARTRFNKRIALPACAAAMGAADDGLVLLVQRRIGDGEFEYLAARTGKPYRTPDLPTRAASPSETARLRGEAVFTGADTALAPVDLA